MRNYLFVLMAFFFLNLKAQAISNPYIMNHERFVHMTQEDKNTLIIRTMEMMVELESKYQADVKSSGFNQLRFEKYVQMIKKLQGFLISEAVAADYAGMSDKFVKLLESKKDKGCIYGGWVSELETINGVNYCRHPSMVKDPKIKAAYLSAHGSCVGPSKISCNPMVFGYKKQAGEKPFCVDTGFFPDGKTNKAHNVSYECMRAALKDPSDSKLQDSKDKRMQDMSKAMQDNPQAFNAIHSYIFQTCACGKGDMNKEYKDYIRPHRTCFGMMNSLRAFKAKDCGDFVSSIPKANEDFMNKWNNFFNDQNIKKLSVPASRHPVDFDNDYKAIMKDPVFKQYCDGEQPKPEEKKEWYCESKCSAGVAAADGVKKYKCEVTKAGWKVNNKDEPLDILKFQIKEVKDLLISEKSMKIKLEDGAEASCPVSIVEEKVQEVPLEKSCTLSVKDGDDKTKALATLVLTNLKDEDVTEIKWAENEDASKNKSKEALFVKAKEKKAISVSVTHKGDSSKPIKCISEIPALDAVVETKKAYDIKATAEAAEAATVKVNAIVKIDGVDKTKELPPGFKISWTRKGSGVAKLKAPEKKETKTGAVQDGISAGAEEAAPASAPKAEDVEVATGDSITEVRVADEYETCATLIDDKGAKAAGPSCDKIPAVKPVNNRPAPVNNNRPPQPPGLPVSPFNTSTPGML